MVLSVEFRALLLTALLPLLGCAVDLGPTWVEIGEGQAQHSQLSDGDEVSIVEGPQGGYMVALSLRPAACWRATPAIRPTPTTPG